jgi:hypothetical protein
MQWASRPVLLVIPPPRFPAEQECGFTCPHDVDGVGIPHVASELGFHIFSTKERCNPKEYRHLRDSRRCLSYCHAPARKRTETHVAVAVGWWV